MAKIYLRGGLMHELSNIDAEQLKQAWQNKKDSIADFGSISFKIQEIKSIVLDSISTIGPDDEQAKAFETELNGRTFEQYIYDMGYVLGELRGGYPKGTVCYSKVSEYTNAKKLNNALEDLKLRRIYAKKINMNVVKDIIQPMVKHIQAQTTLEWAPIDF